MQGFWDKVDQSAGEDACWPWTGSVGSHGYGDLRIEGRHWLAHRYSLSMREPLAHHNTVHYIVRRKTWVHV